MQKLDKRPSQRELYAKKLKDELTESLNEGLIEPETDEITSITIDLVKKLRAEFSPYGTAEQAILLQLLRAVLSIGSNYIEGKARASTASRFSFYRVARGSAYEAYLQSKCMPELRITESVNKLCMLIDSRLIDLVNSTSLNNSELYE